MLPTQKTWKAKRIDRGGNQKSLLVRLVALKIYQTEIKFSRPSKIYILSKKSYGISNLLLTQKNVVVVCPENVVVKNGENVVDPSENVVVVQKNVVGGGIKTQWAALSAARQMALEKPLSFVMAWLYNQARTYFQSQIWPQGGAWGGPSAPFLRPSH